MYTALVALLCPVLAISLKSLTMYTQWHKEVKFHRQVCSSHRLRHVGLYSTAGTETANGKRSLAAASILLGVGLFLLHKNQDSPLTQLRELAATSRRLEEMVCNGRPTVVDFFAEWCSDCKRLAPALRKAEQLFRDRVNFVTLDGDTPANAALVERLHVDGIPHVAFVDKDANLVTTLLGGVPEATLLGDVEALAEGRPLPVMGLQAPLDNLRDLCR